MGELRILDMAKGDTKLEWDSAKPAEVDAARETFDYYVKDRKWAAFEVGIAGRKTDRKVEEFSPELGKVVIVPPLAGG
jgi:hypothetical protein